METKRCCAIHDFDGVYIAGEDLMDDYIMEFCRKATNRYCNELFKRQFELLTAQQQLESDRNIYGKEMMEIIRELQEIERLLKEHFDLKDQVLEESEDKYRNKINYDEIKSL